MSGAGRVAAAGGRLFREKTSIGQYGFIALVLDSEGNPFWDVEADAACFEAIRRNVKAGIPVIEMNHNINDPEFSGKAADLLLEMLP